MKSKNTFKTILEEIMKDFNLCVKCNGTGLLWAGGTDVDICFYCGGQE